MRRPPELEVPLVALDTIADEPRHSGSDTQVRELGGQRQSGIGGAVAADVANDSGSLGGVNDLADWGGHPPMWVGSAKRSASCDNVSPLVRPVAHH